MRAPAEPRLRLRSLANKLALLFSTIIAIAFAGVLLYVVPHLQSNLEQQGLRDLRRVAEATSEPLAEAMGTDVTESQLNMLVRAASDRADARVMLLGVQRSVGLPTDPAEEPSLYIISDSQVEPRARPGYGVAMAAVARNAVADGVGRERGDPVARVASPLFFRGRADWVAVYARDLSEVAEIVGLIRRRVLVAAAVALLVASAGGYLLAQTVAARVRRVESAARQVAAGNFVDPVPVDSADEIGDLARAFNEMQEQLVRLDRARREFIANASHELRTPIFSLGGFAELLQDEELDRDTRDDFLGQMREQTERLKKLAADLLDLSRLDAGALQLTPESVDLGDLARDVATEFVPALSGRGTELEVEVADEVSARCDRQRMAQIVRILLDNSLRHTPEGAPVRLSVGAEDGTARVVVADRGPELDGRRVEETVVRRAFDRFYTGDAAGGSGLGLAIARELAERMDGGIAIHAGSRETVLTVELPAVDARGEEREPKPAPDPAGAADHGGPSRLD